MRAYDIIANKRDGGQHTPEEIGWLVNAVADGSLPDYQLAAWLMAVRINGMTRAETAGLTAAMRDSGTVLGADAVPAPRIDKHSTGGVGDKTTLVVVPILAAAGAHILKMTGRGLAHTGGTADKLESLPGMLCDMPLERALDQTRDVGGAIIAQSESLAPADRRMYALRDVTATIDSMPLIAASIMSKKLASGAEHIVLDVKCGAGSFMRTIAEARILAQSLVSVGSECGVRAVAAVTAMDEPIGWAVGNALEVREAWMTLTGTGRVDARFRSLCLAISARCLSECGIGGGAGGAASIARSLLEGGQAAAAFARIVECQGGDSESLRHGMPEAPCIVHVLSHASGWVVGVDARAIGCIVQQVGGGRARKDDSVDPAVGVELLKMHGNAVAIGDALAVLHLRRESDGQAVADRLRRAFTIAGTRKPSRPIVLEWWTPEDIDRHEQ